MHNKDIARRFVAQCVDTGKCSRTDIYNYLAHYRSLSLENITKAISDLMECVPLEIEKARAKEYNENR